MKTSGRWNKLFLKANEQTATALGRRVVALKTPKFKKVVSVAE
jgi:hypothetical protein